MIKMKSDSAPYISVVHQRYPLRVYLDTILYADTFRNAVYLHTDAGIFKTYITFSEFRQKVAFDRRFLGCYKGCIVNMDRVKKIAGEDFLMDSGEKVQIRKRGCGKVKRAYLQYILSKQTEK